MKKMGKLTIAAIISGIVLSNHSALAVSKATSNNSSASEEAVQQIDTSNFIKFSGIIKEIEKDTKTTRFIVENGDNSIEMICPITDDVLLLDNAKGEELNLVTIEKGAKVDVYYAKNKPMILIYPAVITPDIVVVNGQEVGEVKVSKFDKDFVSLDNELKLNISKETTLLNENGDQIKEDELAGKELMVFYTFTTRSIPAQTTPTKIIALTYTDEKLLEVQDIIDEDHYFIKDTRMIPVRKIAEHLGYTVQRDIKQNSILLHKQARSFLLTIGKRQYGYNRSLGYFEVEPEIKNGKSYVSEEFLELLLEK